MVKNSGGGFFICPRKITGTNKFSTLLLFGISFLRIRKAEVLAARSENSDGRTFVAENGHGRHPDQ